MPARANKTCPYARLRRARAGKSARPARTKTGNPNCLAAWVQQRKKETHRNCNRCSVNPSHTYGESSTDTSPEDKVRLRIEQPYRRSRFVRICVIVIHQPNQSGIFHARQMAAENKSELRCESTLACGLGQGSVLEAHRASIHSRTPSLREACMSGRLRRFIRSFRQDFLRSVRLIFLRL